MDQKTIELLAAAITSQLSSQFLLWTIGQAAISALCAGFAAYAGGYLRRRGENLATKQDFDALLSQLAANTLLVETVKAEVGIQDWAERQWRQLRITKLEELMLTLDALDVELNDKRNHAADGKIYYGPENLNRIDAIGTLYFPELSAELRTLASCSRNLTRAYIQRSQQIMTGDNSAKSVALDGMLADFSANNPPYLRAVDELRSKSREVLISIVNADPVGRAADTKHARN